jgi:hypothetical protein
MPYVGEFIVTVMPVLNAQELYIVVDSTGLKVYGEGDGAARAVEGKAAWNQ